MFKIAQVDPETSAIHVNAMAVTQHEYNDDLFKILDSFLNSSFIEYTHSLADQYDTQKRAHLVSFSGTILHEYRHYADLLLTPYGFHRLRIAFEFYYSFLSLIIDDRVTQIPIPLISGLDAVNRKLLHLENFENSPLHNYAKLFLNRAKIIAADNKVYTAAENQQFRIGGDAILEALAFSTQWEWTFNLFNTPECRKLMPKFFERHFEGDEFNLKYRWYYPLLEFLHPDSKKSNIQLMNCILFASLCGSFASGSKHKLIEDHGDIDPTRGRFVDEKLPNNRLFKLFQYFKDSSSLREYNDWDTAYYDVSQGCAELWGKSIEDEIAEDIENDEKFLSRTINDSPNFDCIEAHPIWAFEDLLRIRKIAFKLLKADPTYFINPAKFSSLASELPAPFIYNYPCGMPENLFDNSENWKPIISIRVPLKGKYKDGEPINQEAKNIYSFWVNYSENTSLNLASALNIFGLKKFFKNKTKQKNTDDSWEIIFGDLAPAFKLFLYGYNYRTMLECDISLAAHMPTIKDKIIWDLAYYYLNDVSESEPYFTFFNLETAECDICRNFVTQKDSKIVSALTLRQNESLIEDFQRKYSTYKIYHLLIKDWSSWLVCQQCSERWNFH